MWLRHNIGRWILAAWFMLLGCTASYGYTITTGSTAPAYTNVYANPTSPTYQFRSTSVYYSSFRDNSTFVPLADDPYAGNGQRKGPRRSSPWDEDPETGGGNEIGVVDDPVPVGEPLIMLLLALLYMVSRTLRTFHRQRSLSPIDYISQRNQQ